MLSIIVQDAPWFFGTIVQIIFIWLPVPFRSWYTDLKHAWLFMGFHLGLSAVFMWMLFHLEGIASSYIYVNMTLVGILTWIKCIRTIPLEGAAIIVGEPQEPIVVDFAELHVKQTNEFVKMVRDGRGKAVQRLLIAREQIAKQRILIDEEKFK